MANSQQTPEDIQSITIVPASIPPLKAGEYVIDVKQTLKNPDHVFSKETSFWVSAPRLSLNPADIYSVYPPADAEGPYSETLPHIVLSRRTLPWERGLEGAENGAGIPWMALLLLDEDDLISGREKPLEVQTNKLKELPHLSKDKKPWEKDDDPCQTLEIPYTRFREIAPAWEDLPYLAHVRRVGTENMESEGIEDKGWFSVLIGNRLPAANKENRVFLISLEGLEPYLPGKNPNPLPASHPESLRLVVFNSWRFVDHTEGKGFDELAAGLKPGPMKIEISEDSKDQLRQEVKSTLDSGYAPLNHTTRQGFQTMSWYRGPLVPLFLPTDPENIVYSSADAALRYDPVTGLMDVSYAAAWQLGRLLGLKNKQFAQALYKHKLGRTQSAAAKMAQIRFRERFGGQAEESMEQVVIDFLEGFNPSDAGKSKRPQHGTVKPPEPETDHFDTLQKTLEKDNAAPDIPEEIKDWLARLFLLYGVPINYLVPHHRMLESESLRFFYLDTTWIGALLDGALSIGRSPETRLYLDKAMAGNFLATAMEGLEIENKSKAELGMDWEGADESRKLVIGHLTGILLRSELVSGYRGIEIVAYDGHNRLKPLRMQRIAQDTLLAIFNGRIEKVVVIQPPHGMHFGVTKENNGDKTQYHKLLEPDDPEASNKITLPMREPYRVVDMHRLTKEIGCEDKPARFVRLMIKKPVKSIINITYSTRKPSTS